MKNTTLATIAAALCLGAAATAIAQPGQGRGPAAWDDLGSVLIDGRMGPPPGRPGPGGVDRETRSFNLGGPVERLQLRAVGSDINCRSVNARFGNGRTRQVFQGTLSQNRTLNVDLPGNERDLNGLTFVCASLDRHDALIRISADVGRYRNDWMSGPNWRGAWARMFNWGSNAVNDWQMVGRENFEGRGDTEMVYTGFRGRRTDSIALMPVNADARCSSVTARFGNGRTQRLNIRNGDMLRRGMYAEVDLPGNMRDLDSLTLRCRSTNTASVTINIYTAG